MFFEHPRAALSAGCAWICTQQEQGMRPSTRMDYSLPSHLSASMPCTSPSLQCTQEGSVEPGTPEGKVDGRPGMLYLPKHGADIVMVGGMFPRTPASCYTPKLKFILWYRKQKLNLVLSVKKKCCCNGPD